MKKGRKLSPEESELWQQTMRHVRQMHKATAQRASDSPGPEVFQQSGGVRPESKHASTLPAPSQTFASRSKSAPSKRILPSAFEAGDPKMDKRAARRRIDIDRRIDLHGMTQAMAHTRLLSFLSMARLDGCRCVLVITGKGGQSVRNPDAPRGVLHSRLQQWMDEPLFRELVTRVAPASQKDGGGGAWYVFLKRL